MERVINFGAGPAVLPLPVIQQLQVDLLSFGSTGVGVLELSHRSATFERDILGGAEKALRTILAGKGEEHFEVLWMTGGGTAQFSATISNVMAGEPEAHAVYLISGSWSERACEEAVSLHGTERVRRIDLRTLTDSGLRSLRNLSDGELALLNDHPTAYIYYCSNETVDGIQFRDRHRLLAGIAEDVPVIADMSSDFMTRDLTDLPRHALVFAGAQKNLGAAGVTVVLARTDFLRELQQKRVRHVPLALDYLTAWRSKSLHNTPPVFAIHVVGLVLQWWLAEYSGSEGGRDGGALQRLAQISAEKSAAVYAAVDEHPLLYCDVDEAYRSAVNCVFKVRPGCTHAAEDAKKVEGRFVLEAASWRQGMTQLQGHRSVGGLRASLYNAITAVEASDLCDFIRQFR